MRGRGLSGPMLVGGGLWDDFKSRAKSAGSSLWGLGKRSITAAAPILLGAGKSAAMAGGSALVSGLTSGHGVKHSLRAGLSAAQGAVDRSQLRADLLEAVRPHRPVF